MILLKFREELHEPKRIDFRRVLSLKLARGPALRAMFKISATTHAAVVRGDFHGDAGEE